MVLSGGRRQHLYNFCSQDFSKKGLKNKGTDMVLGTDIFDTTLDVIQTGIVIINCHATITRINSFAAMLFGIDEFDSVGKPLSTFITKSSLPSVLETGQPIGPVVEGHNGKQLLGIYRPLFGPGGELNGALGAYTDLGKNDLIKQQITDAMQNERELEAILEYSPDGIWIMDGVGKTLRVSKSWENFSGIKREEVIGRMVHDIVAEGIYTDSAAIHVIEKREPVTIIYTTRTHKSALVTANPVFGADGNIWRIISNVRDITQLNRFKTELERSQANSKRFSHELKVLRQQQSQTMQIITRSKAMETVLEIATQTAASEATMLISGETGVGKDIIANFIHNSSGGNGTFIRVNCGAIPESLMESELFGYEEGSFTGARAKGKPGLFELAQGGTLFLDEVGELPFAMQAKLLHALQDHTITRVGGVLPINLHVRVIAATNRDLMAMTKVGSFRKDLYYRLNVIPLHIPPLRDRPDDIVPLVVYFLEKYNKRHKTNKSICPRALEVLLKYSWPGNVRELENTIEWLVLTCHNEEIDVDNLDAFKKEHDSPLPYEVCFSPCGSLKKAREEVEKSMLLWAMKHHCSTRKVAAILGVTQPTIVRLVHKYGLNKAESSQL